MSSSVASFFRTWVSHIPRKYGKISMSLTDVVSSKHPSSSTWMRNRPWTSTARQNFPISARSDGMSSSCLTDSGTSRLTPVMRPGGAGVSSDSNDGSMSPLTYTSSNTSEIRRAIGVHSIAFAAILTVSPLPLLNLTSLNRSTIHGTTCRSDARLLLLRSPLRPR